MNSYLHLLEILQADFPQVLATVTRVIGSAPQKPGSSALYSREGLLSGTVGGGVLEGEVQHIAQKAIQLKKSGYYNFRLDKEISCVEGAICGGQANILIDASPGDHRIVFERIKQSLINRIPGVLVTTVTDLNESGVDIQRFWMPENENHTIPGDCDREIETEVRRLISAGNRGDYSEFKIHLPGENHDVLFLLETVFPPAHLVIAGAGHIGKALSHLGKLLDFEVTVIDNRPEYANSANLPDADHIVVEDIGKAMEELKKTPDTFLVILTRGHQDDAKALKGCIGSEIAYIGMIGSKNKIALMRKDFIQHGWAASKDWDHIHAPIGLDIDSKSVQEIAISIAAQLVKIKNCKEPAMPETTMQPEII